MKQAAKSVGRIQYEPEGSDCRTTGSVSLRTGGWWSADLIVSIRKEDDILLTLHRHGASGQENDGASVDLRLQPADLEALPVLLHGVIAQARKDGVLTRRVRSGSQP